MFKHIAMQIKIDRHGKAPLHAKVEKMLREMIESPSYRKGEFLPKEVELASQLGVARNTVRHAIGKLVNEGLLVRKKGVGTKVAARRISTRLDSWWSFTQEMKKRGLEVVNFDLSVSRIKADDEISVALDLRPGAEVLCLSRLRGTSAGPCLLSLSWFHPRLKLTGAESFDKPLYEMLEEEHGVIAAVSREEISAIRAVEELAEKLGIEQGDPVLFRQRLVSDTDGRAVEFNKVYYRGDGFSYSIDIARN
jgi:GntR family transcriptional regulator